MLTIYFGHKDNMLIQIPSYFDGVYEDEWIVTDITKRIIKEVDKSTVLYPRIIDSPYLGAITPKEISGGAKGLILMALDDDMIGRYFYGEQFGDNTLPLMLEISKTRDIKVALSHIFDFPEDMNTPIFIENTQTIIKTIDEYNKTIEHMIHIHAL